MSDALKDLVKNAPWLVMLSANISILIFTTPGEGSLFYYFKYFIKDQIAIIVGQTYEITDPVLSSLYLSLRLGTPIVGVLLAKPISSKTGKNRLLVGQH